MQPQPNFMNFTKLFQKSNSSIYQLQGCVLDCSIEQVRGNKVIVDTGMRSSFVCSQDELNEPSVVVGIAGFPDESGIWNSKINKSTNEHKYTILGGLRLHQSVCKRTDRVGGFKQSLNSTSVDMYERDRSAPLYRRAKITSLNSTCIIGIEEKRSVQSGELTYNPPKSIEKLSRRKLIWTELTKLWRTSSKNRVKGFILNSVNGGYAVALAGYIAFLPKSLCLNKKVFIGQWRQFAIISMNPKIVNIVVKEVKVLKERQDPSNSGSRSVRSDRSERPGLAKNKYKVNGNRSKKTR